MTEQEIQARLEASGHFPDGDGWMCACGYDFFGGSAAYGWQLFAAHLETVGVLVPEGAAVDG